MLKRKLPIKKSEEVAKLDNEVKATKINFGTTSSLRKKT